MAASLVFFVVITRVSLFCLSLLSCALLLERDNITKHVSFVSCEEAQDTKSRYAVRRMWIMSTRVHLSCGIADCQFVTFGQVKG